MNKIYSIVLFAVICFTLVCLADYGISVAETAGTLEARLIFGAYIGAACGFIMWIARKNS